MPYENYSADEVESRGEEIYARRIRKIVEPGNHGRFIVIDIQSGDFEVDDNDLQATKRALARHPEGVFYGLRIGYPTAYTLGGHVTLEQG